MVLSSDCISVARTVQTVTSMRFAGTVGGSAIVPPAAAPSSALRAHSVSSCCLARFSQTCSKHPGSRLRVRRRTGRRAWRCVPRARRPRPARRSTIRASVGTMILALRSASSLAALDQAGRLERIEQAHDRRAVERQRGGEVLLSHRHRGAGEVDQRQPRGLGQAEWLQAAVDLAAPLPGRAGDDGSKALAQLPLVLLHRPSNNMAYQYMACHLSWQPGSQWWSLPALDRRSVARADAE